MRASRPSRSRLSQMRSAARQRWEGQPLLRPGGFVVPGGRSPEATPGARSAIALTARKGMIQSHSLLGRSVAEHVRLLIVLTAHVD